MYESCPSCKLKYERSPGYFLGSIYVGYGLTAMIVTIAYVGLHFGAGWSNRTIIGPLLAFVVIFPLFFHRYARALWLAMDLYFDQSDDTM